MTPRSDEDGDPTPGRRGWREHVEPGLYRSHRVRCPRSTDHRAGRRCGCPFSTVVPGIQICTTRQVSHPGLIGEPTRYLTTRHRVLAPNALANVATDYRLRIDPALGAHDVGDISREQVEIFVAELAARAPSRRMVTGTVASLRAILSAGLEWGWISTNPALRSRLPPPEHHARGEMRGLVISASGFTPAGVETATSALPQHVIVLAELEEVVFCLERGHDLRELIRAKVHAAMLDRNPLH